MSYLDYEGLKYLWSKISMEDYPNNETLVAILNAIDATKANKDEIPLKVSQLENDSKFTTEKEVEALYKKLSSNTVLGFYCIEDVTIVVNGVSTTYPANSNVEIKLFEDDVFEIVPTSNNSILTLTAFPGALGIYYPWLEGIKQFSNILFDMNDVEMYSKWSQGNQGAYQVQFAQYTNCIFWSDNTYVSDVSKRTNYTLYYTSQLPLCYSNIPDNTFKAFYLAFNVNSDPNWGNKLYRDSFAKATWATQVFSYYGARTIGIFGHDDPDFNIVLPKDCRGLMYQSTAIENAGTFDAINVTNFGAKSGSWREAFGQCSSLRNLYIKNLKVNLNISWSPINYESINFIISTAANTNAITISVSPYTYNLLSDADFELAASKNITIALISTNYIEDKRLSEIANKIDKTYVDEQVAGLVGSAPDTLNTIGALATAFQENKEVVDILNEAIVIKADKTYVDEAIANIPTESDVFIVDCPDGSTISHTFGQIMTAINANKVVYISLYGAVLASLKYVADDNSFIEFSALRHQIEENKSSVWIDNININSDNSFSINKIDLSPNNDTSAAILYTPQNLTDE
jgi:ATP-dependent protease HslVU (ClpYQ) peptidase subunit